MRAARRSNAPRWHEDDAARHGPKRRAAGTRQHLRGRDPPRQDWSGRNTQIYVYNNGSANAPRGILRRTLTERKRRGLREAGGQRRRAVRRAEQRRGGRVHRAEHHLAEQH